MVSQWFIVADGMLDEMIARYPAADAAQKAAIEAELRRIQRLSDAIVDGWLRMEEKLATLRGMVSSEAAGEEAAKPADTALPCAEREGETETASALANAPAGLSAHAAAGHGALDEARRQLIAGQGYYDLAVYREAAAAFRRAVELRPESLAARMFLAMSHMRLEEWEDAERHFLFIVRTAQLPKLKALGFNALGCIQAVTANLEQAAHYFRLACEADPAFTGAARNLANCMANAGPLTLHFGDSAFGCT